MTKEPQPTIIYDESFNLDRIATALERIVEHGITIRAENTDYPIAIQQR